MHVHTHSHVHATQGHLGEPELVRREENEKAQTKTSLVVSEGGMSKMRWHLSRIRNRVGGQMSKG